MPKAKPLTKVELSKGTAFEIKPENKYLVIFPNDAKIDKIAPALQEFFKPTAVFILIAKDVTEIKIAELMEEKL